MTLIDKYAYKSKLSGINGWQKALLACVPMVICLVASSVTVSIVTTLCMIGGAVMFGGVNFKQYIKLLIVPVIFLVLGVAPVIFQNTQGQEVLFSLNIFSLGITQVTLNFGIALFTKALATVTCLYFFVLTTPMPSVINFLVKIKCPQMIIDLMELIYRFIFIIWEQAGKIYIAQTSRLGYINVKSSIQSFGELASSLFIKSMKRVQNLNYAMESRGADGGGGVIMEESSKAVVIVAVVFSATLIIIALAERVF